MLDDCQEAFGLALIQLGYSANTTNTAEMDEALALLEQQKPLLRDYTTDDDRRSSSGDVWIGHIWGADIYQIQTRTRTSVYYIPEEGGVRGSDTMAIFSGEAPDPVAANLFINHMLDAQISAENTNFIYYMGPNEAAKAFIDPDILADPTVNPDQGIVDKLEELLDLGPTVREVPGALANASWPVEPEPTAPAPPTRRGDRSRPATAPDRGRPASAVLVLAWLVLFCSWSRSRSSSSSASGARDELGGSSSTTSASTTTRGARAGLPADVRATRSATRS